MKKKVEPLDLAARVSSDGYSLQFYCDKPYQTYSVAIVNDKVKNKEYYNQIIISRDSTEKISNWLLKATDANETDLSSLYVECVSHCEILSFSKLDNCIYVQLYQVASFPRQKRGKTDDEFSMSERVAGVLARTLLLYLHTGVPNS
jgi:hypothetical protein